MEIYQLKSLAEDQMEMMMLMDKLPDLPAAQSEVGELSPTEFPAGASSSNGNNDNINGVNAGPHFVENYCIGSSAQSANPTSSILFGCNKSPTQRQPVQNFLSNPNTVRWRGTDELSGTDAYLTPCQKMNSVAAMREMIFQIAATQPIHIDPESVKPPKRRNVKISKDPQSVAARQRRERISEKIRILKRLVPGGTKMDTASMLDEAIHYVKFLKTQVQSLERAQANRPAGIGFPVAMSSGSGSYLPMEKAYQQPPHQSSVNY